MASTRVIAPLPAVNALLKLLHASPTYDFPEVHSILSLDFPPSFEILSINNDPSGG